MATSHGYGLLSIFSNKDGSNISKASQKSPKYHSAQRQEIEKQTQGIFPLKEMND